MRRHTGTTADNPPTGAYKNTLQYVRKPTGMQPPVNFVFGRIAVFADETDPHGHHRAPIQELFSCTRFAQGDGYGGHGNAQSWGDRQTDRSGQFWAETLQGEPSPLHDPASRRSA